ncbi:cytochrome P450 [Dendrothele bispora CBS 962.96]|uniref:Cytochrome P450 n=1 Tax=Dendrothele bispora (strain CBS 962.96) TaxID=1314807 RepID=A0A4S8MRW9_DENBC|nr:cytochrome P450 [Dendrothele bispora CBS 962.96]
MSQFFFAGQTSWLPLVLVSGGLLVLVTYECWSRAKKFYPIANISGPKSDSWWYGCCADFGENIFKWQAEFGAVYQYKACIGDHRIVIADPRAIDYVHKNVHSFPRSAKFRAFIRLFISNGPGMSWVEGDDHRRQRSVLNPPFSPSHIRDLFPKFLDKARELVDKWQGIVKAAPEENGTEIEVTNWMQRATLDVIGTAAFGVEFNTLHNQQSEIALIFEKFIIVNAVAVDAVASARAALESGDKGGKEVKLEKPKLSPSEVYAQFGTFLLAGEDTTANALAWALVELCSIQKFQTMMRDEINKTYAAVHEQGRLALHASDLDKMTFTQAFIKAQCCHFAGVRWRFALQEMQVFLIEMVRKFRFSLPEGVRIEREMTLGSIPVVSGDPSREQRLPLIIASVDE